MRSFSRPFLVLVSMFVTSAMAQPFLGLSLAPRFLTVAETLPDGTSRAIAQVEGVEAYQAAMAAIASKEPHDSTHLNQALQKSLKLAQAATNTHFNQRVQIPVVSLPSIVSDRSVIATVKEAMGSIGFSSQHEQLRLQAIEMSYAAHYAYGLGTAKGLGLDQMEVDWEMGSYEALLVEYNLGSLSFTLIDLAEHGCVVRGQVALPEWGESAITEEASTVSRFFTFSCPYLSCPFLHCELDDIQFGPLFMSEVGPCLPPEGEARFTSMQTHWTLY